MNLKLHLTRTLGALIVLIALLAWPSLASAHEGHAHMATPAASVHHDQSAPQDYAATPQSVLAVNIEEPASQSDGPAACAGSCCAGAPCGGGMALSIVPSHWDSDVLAALAERSEPGFHLGFAGEGLRKPPRSFT